MRSFNPAIRTPSPAIVEDGWCRRAAGHTHGRSELLDQTADDSLTATQLDALVLRATSAMSSGTGPRGWATTSWDSQHEAAYPRRARRPCSGSALRSAGVWNFDGPTRPKSASPLTDSNR